MTDATLFPECRYRFGIPQSTGVIKQQIEDFVVTEDLGYEPSGEGEHVFLWVEKRGTNTAYVAEQLAKQTGLPLRSVTYAGRKDKFALTRQWFGLHAPNGLQHPIESISIEGVNVLSQTRHNKKLRVGQLKGNRFELVVRELTKSDSLIEKLEIIKHQGVPNYFGDQRFGVMRADDGSIQYGGTLALAMRMAEGEVIRNRNKRNMAISALRSAIFNAFVSARLAQGTFDKVCPGDACILTGSRSFFIEQGDTLAESQRRYEENVLSPSAPLLGAGSRATHSDIGTFESQLETLYAPYLQCLQLAGVKTLRRKVKLMPQALEWQVANDRLTIQFSLESGCFATSVLRECVMLNPTQESGND